MLHKNETDRALLIKKISSNTTINEDISYQNITNYGGNNRHHYQNFTNKGEKTGDTIKT